MRRLLLFLILFPAVCFAQYRPAARTNPDVSGKDAAGICFRGHRATESATTAGYCAEATALFARMTVAPSTARKVIIDSLIIQLKSAGFWTRLDNLQVYACHDETAAYLNWIADDDNATEVDVLTFTEDVGLTCTANAYINTGFNPSSDGVNYTQNAASWGYVCQTTGTDAGGSNGVVVGGSYLYNVPWHGTASHMSVNYGSFDGATSAISSCKHYYIGTRSDASNNDLYVDKGIHVNKNTSTSTAPPNGDVFIGGYNNGSSRGEPNTYQYSLFFAGDKFSTSEVSDLIDIFEWYLDKLGCGLLP